MTRDSLPQLILRGKDELQLASAVLFRQQPVYRSVDRRQDRRLIIALFRVTAACDNAI